MYGSSKLVGTAGAESPTAVRPRTHPDDRIRALLLSERVTAPTREALLARLAAEPVTEPRFFSAGEFATMQAVCARLIPQDDRPVPVDLAGPIDARLASGGGNGWRYATMPPDGVAFTLGLRGIEEAAALLFGAQFRSLDKLQQDQVLSRVQAGEPPGESWGKVPAGRFFEELLAEVTEFYYAHPLAQDEIGYVGMADAAGWQDIGLDEHADEHARDGLPGE